MSFARKLNKIYLEKGPDEVRRTLVARYSMVNSPTNKSFYDILHPDLRSFISTLGFSPAVEKVAKKENKRAEKENARAIANNQKEICLLYNKTLLEYNKTHCVLLSDVSCVPKTGSAGEFVATFETKFSAEMKTLSAIDSIEHILHKFKECVSSPHKNAQYLHTVLSQHVCAHRNWKEEILEHRRTLRIQNKKEQPGAEEKERLREERKEERLQKAQEKILLAIDKASMWSISEISNKIGISNYLLRKHIAENRLSVGEYRTTPYGVETTYHRVEDIRTFIALHSPTSYSEFLNNPSPRLAAMKQREQQKEEQRANTKRVKLFQSKKEEFIAEFEKTFQVKSGNDGFSLVTKGLEYTITSVQMMRMSEQMPVQDIGEWVKSDVNAHLETIEELLKEMPCKGVGLNTITPNGRVLNLWPSVSNSTERTKKWKSLVEVVFMEQQIKRARQSVYNGKKATDPTTWFSPQMTRSWKIFVGPTNSGKTYHALNVLKKSTNGMYLAPLRLMALEQYDDLKNMGTTQLITGEEHIVSAEGPVQFVSATVEAVDLEKEWDVVVVDEAQMLLDPERGWAWTQALLGVNAHQLCVCTSPDGLNVLKKLIQQCGETYEIHELDRLTPLDRTAAISPSAIKKGDAVIAFSRHDVLAWRDNLQNAGFSVSCVYGDLGPEVRRQQAELFRNGETDVLVSTDAIGMGLNLPIQRVVFTATEKFNGKTVAPLSNHEWKQIAGRAGRKGMYEKGYYTTIKGCLNLKEETFGQNTTEIYRPTWAIVKEVAKTLKSDRLEHIFNVWREPVACVQSISKWTDVELVTHLDKTQMPLEDKYTYSTAPVRKSTLNDLLRWVSCHNRNQSVDINTEFLGEVKSTKDLQDLEHHAHVLQLYRWARLKYPAVYTTDVDSQYAEAQNKIANALKHRIKKTCVSCDAKLPSSYPHKMCQKCYQTTYWNNSWNGNDFFF